MNTRVLLAITLIAITLAVGCGSDPNNQREVYKTEYIGKPTLVIKTTQGDIRVVLLASSEEPEYYEEFFRFFNTTAHRGYYNGPIRRVKGPRGANVYYETIGFYRAENSRTEQSVETQRFLNVQPVVGTLYYDNKESAQELPMPRAIVSNFQIVTRTSQDLGYPKEIMLPSAGTTYSIGQVVEGMDVLEKLAAKLRGNNQGQPVEKVISITKGPDYMVLAKKYVDLCNGTITRFDEVLETKK